MHNNGDNYFWGIHMGWWSFMLVVVIVLVVLFGWSRKRK
jgi:Sec-independent protein translocase protein TatA